MLIQLSLMYSGLPAIEGDLKHALIEPNTVVVTESTAKKYFGTTHVLGKTLETKR